MSFFGRWKQDAGDAADAGGATAREAGGVDVEVDAAGATVAGAAVAADADAADAGAAALDDADAVATDVDGTDADGTDADAAAAIAAATGELTQAELEQQWRQAALAVAEHWPQLRQELPAVLGRMRQIAARYGDEQLWQRAPAGLMREAAIELFGMPTRADAGLLQGALRAAHEQGRQAALARRRDLAGLAPPQLSRRAPAPLSEDERIIQGIATAKRSSLF